MLTITRDVLGISSSRGSAVRRTGRFAEGDLAEAREMLAALGRLVYHIASVPADACAQTAEAGNLSRSGSAMSLAEYPGFAFLTDEMRSLLLRAETGEADARPALLEKVADVVNVFIGLDLLQYVFMPTPEEDGSEPVAIDLIAPSQPEAAAIAWFSVDEAGYDEFRDAVTLFGDIADVLNPPIVLDVDDDDD